MVDRLTAAAPPPSASASIFDVLLLSRLGVTLRGGLDFALNALLHGAPSLAPWRDELAAALAWHLQTSAVVGAGATVEESLFGWTRRAASNNQDDTAVQRVVAGSLLGSVAVPYLSAKLRGVAATAASPTRTAPTSPPSLARLALAMLQLSEAAYLIAFATGAMRWPSPWLHLANARLVRADEAAGASPPLSSSRPRSLVGVIHWLAVASARAAPRLRAIATALLIGAYVAGVARRGQPSPSTAPPHSAASSATAAATASAVAWPATEVPPPPPELEGGCCDDAANASDGCPLCGRPHAQPAALPCGHVCCMECILQHARRTRQEQAPVVGVGSAVVLITCPVSGTLFRLDRVRPLFDTTTATLVSA